jgi:VIT1/CCC1 family predicted Fe2+/Mn2+ transporter
MSMTHEQVHGHQGWVASVQEYLGEFVYGGIDGSVTTFAVVAGATGAGLPSGIVIILGLANLIADGFAMSVGSYLSTKSEKDNYEKHRRIEYWEVEHIPEKEKEEVRDIYRKYGFEGELLEQIVAKITQNKDIWVDVMMREELEMMPENKSPLAMGAVTFASFLIMGLVPLLAYLWDYSFGSTLPLFGISCLLTSLTFVLIGFLKAIVTHTHKLKAIAETLFLGAAAAGLSYWVGYLLEGLV